MARWSGSRGPTHVSAKPVRKAYSTPVIRYFFHTADGSRERDTEGVALASLHDARVEAIKFAGDRIAEQPDMLADGRPFRVEVTNEHGLQLFTVVTFAIDSTVVGDAER